MAPMAPSSVRPVACLVVVAASAAATAAACAFRFAFFFFLLAAFFDLDAAFARRARLA